MQRWIQGQNVQGNQGQLVKRQDHQISKYVKLSMTIIYAARQKLT